MFKLRTSFALLVLLTACPTEPGGPVVDPPDVVDVVDRPSTASVTAGGGSTSSTTSHARIVIGLPVPGGSASATTTAQLGEMGGAQ